MTDSFLSDGFQLFHYLARCRDTEKDTVNTFKYYIDVFNNDRPETFLEAAIHMKNLDAHDFWKISSSEQLIAKMDSVLSLDLERLGILSSPTSDLLARLVTIRDEQVRTRLKNCLSDKKCQELVDLVDYLGDNCKTIFKFYINYDINTFRYF